mgnify:CR=1 FL=1
MENIVNEMVSKLKGETKDSLSEAYMNEFRKMITEFTKEDKENKEIIDEFNKLLEDNGFDKEEADKVDLENFKEYLWYNVLREDLKRDIEDVCFMTHLMKQVMNNKNATKDDILEVGKIVRERHVLFNLIYDKMEK